MSDIENEIKLLSIILTDFKTCRFVKERDKPFMVEIVDIFQIYHSDDISDFLPLQHSFDLIDIAMFIHFYTLNDEFFALDYKIGKLTMRRLTELSEMISELEWIVK